MCDVIALADGAKRKLQQPKPNIRNVIQRQELKQASMTLACVITVTLYDVITTHCPNMRSIIINPNKYDVILDYTTDTCRIKYSMHV